jgi:hypothetical protein
MYHYSHKGVDWVFVDHPCYPRPGGIYADEHGVYGDNQVRQQGLCCSSCRSRGGQQLACTFAGWQGWCSGRKLPLHIQLSQPFGRPQQLLMQFLVRTNMRLICWAADALEQPAVLGSG